MSTPADSAVRSAPSTARFPLGDLVATPRRTPSGRLGGGRESVPLIKDRPEAFTGDVLTYRHDGPGGAGFE